MKIICQKSDLSNSINIALKAVSSKTTMPILECIVIETQNDSIRITSNDMELGIETIVKGKVKEEGSIAVNAKVFSEIIRKLPDNEVTVYTKEDFSIEIICEKSKFHISGRESGEFPKLPEVDKNKGLHISQFTLKEVIRQTVFSISDNETNKIMTGELFQIDGGILKVVSLDGHRISIRKIELKESYDPVKVIVPGKTLNEISKILMGGVEDEVEIFFTENHIIFEFDNTMVLSRLIEGEYYQVEQMISSDYETKITVNKKEFLASIDRSTLLLKENDKKPIIMNIFGDTVEMKLSSTIGSMNEEIEVQKEGKDMMIGFNPRFLMDSLRVIEDELVDIYLFNPKAPCFIRDKEESYIYLILPVNFIAGD